MGVPMASLTLLWAIADDIARHPIRRPLQCGPIPHMVELT